MPESGRELSFYKMLKLQDFNEAQRQAICYTGTDPLLLLAGPGSGKTFTILHHLLYLQSTTSYHFDRFFIITFTKSAAQELKSRYQKLAKEHAIEANAMPWFGTFHSFFYQLLSKSNHTTAKSFITEKEADKLLQKAIQTVLSPEAAREIYPKDRKEILSAYGIYKNTLNRDVLHKSLPQTFQEEALGIFDAYEKLRKEQGSYSFDDILYDAYFLLKRDSKLRREWSQYIEGLFMDEFQDTNPIQFGLLSMLYHEKMLCMAVGDDDQSIYGFRGSSPAIMREFQARFHARVMMLTINYRCSANIVAMSSKMISANRTRYEKRLCAQDEENTGNANITGYINEMEQYKHISTAIKERGGNHFVLYRTNAGMQKGAVILARNGITVSMPEAKEEEFQFLVQDLLHYVRWIYDVDASAWKNIVNRPSRFITSETLFASEGIQSLEEFIARIKKEACIGVSTIERLQLWNMQKERASRLGIFPCLMYIRKVMKYDTYLEQRYGKNEELLQACRETLGLLTQTWKDCSSIRELEESLQEQPKKRKQQEEVILMTMHGSKGLECDTVWIPDCNEGNIPYGSMVNPLFSEELEEEERRLLYVGMTRAKKCLELSYLKISQENSRPMSRFLKELGD